MLNRRVAFRERIREFNFGNSKNIAFDSELLHVAGWARDYRVRHRCMQASGRDQFLYRIRHRGQDRSIFRSCSIKQHHRVLDCGAELVIGELRKIIKRDRNRRGVAHFEIDGQAAWTARKLVLNIRENPEPREAVSHELEFIARYRFPCLQAGCFRDFRALITMGAGGRDGGQPLAARLCCFGCSGGNGNKEDCKYRDHRESDSAKISGKRC